MAAPGGFEQWQKDAFFSAAEEVQESADLMESVYRAWLRDRSDGVSSEILDELQRELLTALGTAKWQLEQFERAVSSSDDKYSFEESTVARRRQFVIAMEDQIARVEKVVSDSLIEGREQRFNWVKLDDGEQDDLVAFLSTPPEFSPETKSRDGSCSNGPSRQKNLPIAHIAMTSNDGRREGEVASREISNGEDEACSRAELLNGQRRNLSSGDDSHWKIDIADEKDEDRKSSPKMLEISNRTSSLPGGMKRSESLTRLKWFRNSLWKAKSDEHLPLRYDVPNYLGFRGVTFLAQRFNGLTERSRSCFSGWRETSRLSKQLLGRMGGLHIQGPQCNSQLGRSIRITLVLVLSIFLIVPFLLCSA